MLGLFYLENIKRFCIYNFKSKEVIKVLYKNDLVRVRIDNLWVDDIIDYKDFKWCLKRTGYIGEDLNGLDICEEKSLLSQFGEIVKGIFS